MSSILDDVDLDLAEQLLAETQKNPTDWDALEREREAAGENKRSRSYRNPKKSDKKVKKGFNRRTYVPK